MKKHSSSLSRRRFLHQALCVGALAGVSSLAGPLVPLNAFAATPETHTEQQTRLLMGTFVTLTVAGAEAARAQEAFARAFAEMERLIAFFDRRDARSALSVLNDQGRLAAAPPELTQVLSTAARIGSRSAHAFNPAIAPVIDLFAAAKAEGRKPAFARRELAEALALAEPGALSLTDHSVRLQRQGMRLTLDGIAKGYIADAASATLLSLGLTNHMVNAGGDIRVSGTAASGKAWTIGVRDPQQRDGLLTACAVRSGGIATSGSYEQQYDRSHHHIISHLTGRSADIAGVTVRAATAMQADALATAVALMPPAAAVTWIEEQQAACLIADRHGRTLTSANWA